MFGNWERQYCSYRSNASHPAGRDAERSIKKGAITEAQADTFLVHVKLEGYIKSNVPQGTMDEREGVGSYGFG
ncbi:hypothetical protein [Candidatus Villigracilis saccharophilus]|uniref:hypothetical protein n=1 Tax=Candidatus Villigracilis saccharophilus TaxID=3140684 RepID=UPI0031368FA6|nr:hypothetical protein [Anaerolineales bacterium]